MNYLPYLTLSIICLCCSGSLSAQTDIEGAEDHPLLSRYPGSHISWYTTEKYFEYDLALGPITGYRHIQKRDTIPGQVYRIFYELPLGTEAVSLGEVYIDHKRAMEQAGFTVLVNGLASGGRGNTPGSSQWTGIALASQRPPGNTPPNMLFAGTSTAGGTFTLIGRLARPEQPPTYIAIYGERHSADVLAYLVDIIEVDEAETGLVSLDADYLASELNERGTISIYGLKFDFDSADLQEASTPVLQQIADYLHDNPEVKLYVIGHTDMTGTLAYNRQLSKARATAVAQALIDQYGIADDRLSPDGLAFLSPKASNQTEDGKAINRRVELVLRQ